MESGQVDKRREQEAEAAEKFVDTIKQLAGTLHCCETNGFLCERFFCQAYLSSMRHGFLLTTRYLLLSIFHLFEAEIVNFNAISSFKNIELLLTEFLPQTFVKLLCHLIWFELDPFTSKHDYCRFQPVLLAG